MYKIIEPLPKFRGLPFKHPLLFPIIVVGLSAIAVCLYANAKYARYNAETHYSLGNALAEKGQYDAAIAEYREAIRLQPNLSEAHFELGIALDDKGQYDAAIAEDREAIRLKPDYAAVHYNLGGALKRTAQNAEASREFVEAHRLDPRITPPD